MEATTRVQVGTGTDHPSSEWLLGLAIVAAMVGVALIALGSGYLGGSLVLAAALAGIEWRPVWTR
jgi:hypothetical protein